LLNQRPLRRPHPLGIVVALDHERNRIGTCNGQIGNHVGHDGLPHLNSPFLDGFQDVWQLDKLASRAHLDLYAS
jgi:hypothetical protein